MILRNDDIGKFTKLDELRRVNDIFLKYGLTHTVALITNGIEERTTLIDYLKSAGNFDIQLHCHDHFDFTKLSDVEVIGQFLSSFDIFDLCGFKKPVTWFPPWNKSNAFSAHIASIFGLKMSNQKVSLGYFIANNGKVEADVINFHSWHEPEQMLLEPAFKLITK